MVPRDAPALLPRSTSSLTENGEGPAVVVTDAHGQILAANAAAGRRFGPALVALGQLFTPPPLGSSENVLSGAGPAVLHLFDEPSQEDAAFHHLAAIVESSDDAVIGKDLEGVITSWNQGATRIFGYRAEDMIGRSVRLLIPPERQGEEEKVLARLRRGERVEHFETVRIARDGRRVEISLSVSPIRDREGRVVGASKVARDITAQREAERKIAMYAERFQSLSHRLLEVQEEERRHLARELHDEVGQNLTAAKLNLKIIAPGLPAPAADRLVASLQLLDQLLGQVRKLSLDLRPPLLDELGLVPALRWLAQQQPPEAAPRVAFRANVESLELSPPLRTACFRVAQEAITNAVRHAAAGDIAVSLEVDPAWIRLVVRDDGVGFDFTATQQRAAQGASFGLLSMNERVSLLGGALEVDSGPGHGTEIRASFPRTGGLR